MALAVASSHDHQQQRRGRDPGCHPTHHTNNHSHRLGTHAIPNDHSQCNPKYQTHHK
jgi:hypothetical protein